MIFNSSRILFVLLISFPLIFNGCSLYGLTGGAIVDGLRPDTKIVDREDYNSIEILREIRVMKDDRSVLKGRFIEITKEYLTLETVFGFENVKREEIFVIEAKSKKNAKLYGLGIGFVMDAYLLLILLCEDPGC